MKSRSRTWFVLVLLLAFGLQGCPPKRPVKVITDQDKALAQLLQKQKTIQALEGSAKLRIYEKGKRRRTVRLLFQLRRPAQLNLQLLGVASQPALIVTSDGKRFAIHNLLNGEFRRGPASRLTKQLGGILPPSLSMQQLVPILMGQIPVLSAGKRVWSKSAQNQHRLELQSLQQKQTLWFDFQTPRFVRGVLQQKNRKPLELSYGGTTAKGRLPRAIRVKASGHGMRFSWIFLDVAVNPNIKGNPFVLKPPKGVTVVDM